MIVKMIILRLLGSNDDKEKIGKVRPESSSVGSTGRTDALASVHPMVVGRTDAMIFWCRRESKPSQLIGTGRSDGSKRGIGALGVLCSREDASCARAKSSAPVEPEKHRCIPSV